MVIEYFQNDNNCNKEAETANPAKDLELPWDRAPS